MTRFTFYVSRFTFLTLAALLLTSCITLTDFEASYDNSRDGVATLSGENGKTLTQTFQPPEHINSLTLWLATETSNRWGALTIEIGASPEDGSPPLFTAQYFIEQLPAGGSLTVGLPEIAARGRPLSIKIHSSGSPVEVRGRNEDVYPDGEALLDGQPLDADIALRMTYSYKINSLFKDAATGSAKILLAAPLGLTLLLPGWLILTVSGLRPRFDAGEQIAISTAISLAFYPLLLLWSTQAGFHWGMMPVWIFYAVCTLAGLSIMAIRILARKRRFQKPRFSPHTLALLAVFGLTLASRLIMARDLTAPPWVDAVHHAAITRLILDAGQLPQTYDPYIPIAASEYHAGFHTTLAFFLWLTGFDIRLGMLIFGQALNALMVFAAYLLTTNILRDTLDENARKSAGIFAALIAGLATPMPAYFTSWGRYTQLAGLLILPALFCFAQRLWKPPEGKNIPATILAALSLGGLFLVHYRVAAFALCLLAAVFLSEVVFSRQGLTEAFHGVGRVLAAGAGALLLALPWALPAIQQVFWPVLARGGEGGVPFFSDFSWYYLDTASGKEARFLAILGFLWGLARQWRLSATLALWVGLMFALANLGALGLPGGSFVNSLSVTISLFLPIAVAAGYFLTNALRLWRDHLPQSWHSFFRIGTVALTLLCAVWAVKTQLPILNPATILFHEPDAAAMDWIEANIPPDETILINPFAWGYGLFGSNDGGGWIPALAGRKTMPPPVLYGLGAPTEVSRINAICQQVIDNGANPEGLWRILGEQNINYLFIGGRGGVLSVSVLESSPYFKIVYEARGVYIFSRNR